MATSLYQYDIASGVIIPDTADVQAQVIQEFQAVFGNDLVTDPSTPQGVLITMFTQERIAVINNNAQLANQINPNIAGGVYLDAIWALLGGQRTPAQFSTVTAIVTGAPGAAIPTTAIATTTAGDQFSPVLPINIGSNGQATAQFQALVAGAVAIPADSLTNIQFGVLGWETINNPNAGTVGGPVESDAQVRIARLNTLALQSTALPAAIESGLYGANIGVASLWFQENVTGSTVTINGVSMTGHSIYVAVTNNTPLTNTQVIATLTGTAGTVINPLVPPQMSISVLTSAVLVAGVSYTATADVASVGGMNVGDSVTIVGATPSGYNGTFTVSAINTSTPSFSYVINIASLTTPATGTIVGYDNSLAPGNLVEAQISDGTNVFALLSTVTLDSAGTGSGTFQNILANATGVAASTLTTIVNPVVGWASVTNPGPNTAFSETFLTQVAEVLLATKSAGAAWSTGPGSAPYGPVTIPVVDPVSLQSYNVSFDTATPAPILMQITVHTLSTFSGDPVAAVQSSVLAYAAGDIPGYTGFTVGATVSAFEIAAAIASQNPGLQVVSVLTTLASSVSFASTPITIAVYKQATIQQSSISVFTS